MLLNNLLQYLSDGDFHSGTALARDCGVSKTTVHNHVKIMERDLGLEVSAVVGRGYRIYDGLDLLDIHTIAASFPQAHTNIQLRTASTNDDCRRLLAAAGDKPVICAAEQQTAGRGRRGKVWCSPFAKHLYVSVGFRLSLPLAHISGLTLAAGVVVARMLDSLGLSTVGVKWPNDIWLGTCKVGGLLTEVVGDAQGPCSVVIGLGLNVHPAVMDIDQGQKPAFIAERGISLTRTALLIRVIHELLALRDRYEQAGLSAYRDDWDKYDVLKDKEVTILTDAGVHSAQCLGITSTGLLKIDAPPYELASGDVSIRLP